MRALLVLFVVFSPVLITAATALIATPFLRNHGDRLNRARIAPELLFAAIAMAPIAWAVIKLAPDRNGCADLDGAYETIVNGLFFWCGFVGGIAAAARYVVARPSVEMPIYYALAMVIAGYVIGLGIAEVGFCGWN